MPLDDVETDVVEDGRNEQVPAAARSRGTARPHVEDPEPLVLAGAEVGVAKRTNLLEGGFVHSGMLGDGRAGQSLEEPDEVWLADVGGRVRYWAMVISWLGGGGLYTSGFPK